MMHAELNTLLTKTRDNYESALSNSQAGTYLYGAGFIGRWAVDYLEECGISVLGFVDSDSGKWGSSIAGKPVFSPEDYRIVSAKTILITSRHAVPMIAKRLAHLSACTITIDAFVVHRFVGEIEKIEALLAHDKRSLQTFHAVLMAMLEGSTRSLNGYADDRPYFGRFDFFNRDDEIFVDAGACVGDSLERFLWSVNGVFKQIHAFEPGALQFRALQKRVARLQDEWALRPSSIKLVNKALSSGSGLAYFDESSLITQMTVEHSRSAQVKIDDKHTELISLDSYFAGAPFSFLKIDVEGSEGLLIRGASKSISTHRPRIALSVYHYPTDLFELPQAVLEVNKDYIFTLGHHSSKLIETVLYCRDKNG